MSSVLHLQMSRKDLLALDFEGILKYFRVHMPKKYRTEEAARELMAAAVSAKVNHYVTVVCLKTQSLYLPWFAYAYLKAKIFNPVSLPRVSSGTHRPGKFVGSAHVHSLLPLHLLGILMHINICGGKPCITGMSRKACILETIVNMYVHLAVSTKTFVVHIL